MNDQPTRIFYGCIEHGTIWDSYEQAASHPEISADWPILEMVLKDESDARAEEIAELRRLLREATEALEKSIERDSARAERIAELVTLPPNYGRKERLLGSLNGHHFRIFRKDNDEQVVLGVIGDTLEKARENTLEALRSTALADTANELIILRAENAKLREALELAKPLASSWVNFSGMYRDDLEKIIQALPGKEGAP